MARRCPWWFSIRKEEIPRARLVGGWQRLQSRRHDDAREGQGSARRDSEEPHARQPSHDKAAEAAEHTGRVGRQRATRTLARGRQAESCGPHRLGRLRSRMAACRAASADAGARWRLARMECGLWLLFGVLFHAGGAVGVLGHLRRAAPRARRGSCLDGARRLLVHGRDGGLCGARGAYNLALRLAARVPDRRCARGGWIAAERRMYKCLAAVLDLWHHHRPRPLARLLLAHSADASLVQYEAHARARARQHWRGTHASGARTSPAADGGNDRLAANVPRTRRGDRPATRPRERTTH